jgi:2-keto-4-pentenoate hydratase/2-oxohepta-3-ene-1,7-dioic acid hydratase in catechol pathway
MKLVTFKYEGEDTAGSQGVAQGIAQGDRVGILNEGGTQALDLKLSSNLTNSASDPAFESMLAMIEGGSPALDAARRVLDAPHDEAWTDLGAVTLRSPIPQPPQIRDCLCFEEHLLQAFKLMRKVKAQSEPDPEAALAEYEKNGLFQVPAVWYDRPIYYKGNRLSVIGTEQDILWPDFAQKMDYELEFGFYVGKGGKNISRENARDHIFGYSVFNDISARDTQAIEMTGGLGPSKCKDFDTGNIIGPCIVTADEIDPYNLTMIARVNGEEWSRGSSSTMHWKFEDLISHVSQSETLYPGEFFGSGTVGGGCGLELERYLSPGDVVELEVEGIGVLRNRIVKGNA